MTKAHGWSKNVLIHQIENQTYRKTVLNQTNFAQTLPAESQARAMLAVKPRHHAMNGMARRPSASNPRFCTGQHWLPGGQTAPITE